MIACQCHAVTDRSIMDHIVEGADRVESVGARCGAGTNCGGCHRTIQRLLDAVRAVDEAFGDSTQDAVHATPAVR